MTLHVFSSRIGSRDADALDITRKSATGDGLAFAPSWAILKPALAAREEAARLRADAFASTRGGDRGEAQALRDFAATIERDGWAAYVPAFVAEMERSRVVNADAWMRLLARGRACLECYCGDARRCHRAILRVMILPALGAVDAGEVVVEKAQRSLF